MEMEVSVGRSYCGGRMASTTIGVGVGDGGAVNDQEWEMVESMAAPRRDDAKEASTNGGGMAAVDYQEYRVMLEFIAAANRDANAEEQTKTMRTELINAMTGSWENVVELYRRDQRYHTILIGISMNTALHMSILSWRKETAQKLVEIIISYAARPENKNENEALEVLSIRNKEGNTPLHLAAVLGSINLCRSIISDRYKLLLAVPNNSMSATPLYLAAANGKKDVFFWLYEMCDTEAQARCYCHREDGSTALHAALANGYWDLAFQIIHRQESFADSFNSNGITPLHVLAMYPTAFRSGIYLSFLKNIIYNCIHVEELVPDSLKEKKGLIPPTPCPSNYQTCVRFCQLLWKMISTGKSGPISNKPLDMENLEEGQEINEPHEKGAQGHQGLRSRYQSFFKFIVLNVSKILVVIFWIILGPSEIRKLKKAKQQNIWCLQIVNLLIERAKKCTYKRNSQNHEASGIKFCYSEYQYFTRGPAKATPILVAAGNGVKEIAEKILQEFPMSILDRDSEARDIVMIAAEYRQSHVYDFLLTSSYIGDKNLVYGTWDNYYNTALHLIAKLKDRSGWVVPTGMLRMQWEMKWYQHVKKTLLPDAYYSTNVKGKSPNEIFVEEHRELLSNSKGWVKNTCNSCSVIAALIATLVFASSATVPGGLKEDSGKPIFQHHLAFKLFSVSSLIALCTSLISLLIFLTLLTTNYQYRDFSKSLPQSLIFGLTSLFTSVGAMLLCFCSGHFLMLEDRYRYNVIPVYAFTCLAISYFAFKKFPSYVLLLKATFSKVPERIYKEDPL